MRKCNLRKNSGLRIKEYIDDDDEIEDEFIEQMMNDSDSNADLDLSSPYKKINNLNINENSNNVCSSDCKNNFKEIMKLEEECKNLENKCLLLDYVKSEQINEILEKIEKMNNDINLMIETVKYYEAEETENLKFEELNNLEKKLLKLFVNITNRISKVIQILYL